MRVAWSPQIELVLWRGGCGVTLAEVT